MTLYRLTCVLVVHNSISLFAFILFVFISEFNSRQLIVFLLSVHELPKIKYLFSNSTLNSVKRVNKLTAKKEKNVKHTIQHIFVYKMKSGKERKSRVR